ncbi:thiamine pyrophosphate-dependent enzyme [Amnibacterium kyonggiense]|uniref:2-oxoisovalerate dehydrogenase subunit alpha n=1 Tax=Amnibacterium kyonggiense TaxID=595671 RepID=A0A4R7FQ18_9MICO|nr:thiamine pyrophosphate-dependent enzyme [Amnibacterium kyonggiense]TDS79860.1 pyruvate dehydrogenase E1 component alpha subunit [Amnibacterium kyonggiense]
MASGSETVSVLDEHGSIRPTAAAEPYADLALAVPLEDRVAFLRDMVRTRAFDVAAANLQRQGHLALWVPSYGQEAAQVGSARAARTQDAIFPAYREHAVAMIRGLDPMAIIRFYRGMTHGGWDPAENGGFRLYTLVIGSQTLHATGYAMGIRLDGASGTGDPERDEAVVVYFGDGATAQGDTNEALVFAASYDTPQVFFIQNNHWAISVPVERQSKVPLAQRAAGFGLPGVRVDGNDVLASYAVTRRHLDAARAGEGPALIEALTYRIGAHTSSDDPTKYRSEDELARWTERDPILRLRRHLESEGVGADVFEGIDAEAAELAADVRQRTVELEEPPASLMFEHVYSEPHPLTTSQQEWLAQYEASFGGAS